MRAFAVVHCAVAVCLLTGCGQIGEPLYPALKIPSKVTDLNVTERGDNLDITFTIPPLTTEGLPLKELGRVDLRVGPGPSTWNENEWAMTATRVNVTSADRPGPVEAQVPAAMFAGKEVVAAVRLSNPKGRDSGWSNFKTFLVQPPISDPQNFRVVADPKGVALTWTAAGPAEFRIYRKTEQQSEPVLLATTNEPHYVDISAAYGKTYEYSIQAVRGDIASNIVGPVKITPIDIFPPAVPSGVTASMGINSIELAWNRNTESDFKDYRVLRSEEGGPFTEVARGLDAPVYSDHRIQSGKHYRYEIESEDQDGHVSAPSAPVEITAP